MQGEGRVVLHASTSPLVGLVCGPGATRCATKNNIPDLLLLLRPFGLRPHANVLVTDVHGSSTTLEPAHIRFADLLSLDTTETTAIHAAFAAVMDRFPAQSSTLPALPSVQAALALRNSRDLQNLTPWFAHFESILSMHMGMSEHETFNHPIVCLIAVTTADPDPVATARALVADAALPAALKKPYVDPSIPRICVLIHDPEEAPSANAGSILAALKRVYPTHLLTINTQPPAPDGKAVVPDIWTPYIAEVNLFKQNKPAASPAAAAQSDPFTTTPLNEKGFADFGTLADAETRRAETAVEEIPIRGAHISIADFTAIEALIRDFVMKHVFDRITASMREWERDVASARRGISGRLYTVGLKYFSGSKTATKQPVSYSDQTSGTTIFPFQAPELIMRRLGDYAFMIHDFKYALSIYESVKKDFASSEKYFKFFAGVQEMIAITSLMLTDSPKGGLDTLVDTANQAYSDSKNMLYAHRSTLWIYEMLKEHHLYREAAYLLVKMAGEESDLKGALFIEQAALCFLRISSPMPRKYSFHLMLAAHRFSKCGQRNHAHRNFLTALEAYEDLNWSLINDHLHFALGRQTIHLGNITKALEHFIKLLHKSRQTASAQRGYLAEFLYVYQQYVATMGQSSAPLIPLPVILDSSIVVIGQRDETGGDRSSGSHASGPSSRSHGRGSEADSRGSRISNIVSEADDDAVWESLERELIEFVGNDGSLTPTRRNKQTMHPAAAMLLNNTDASTTTAVGEPVTVVFQWQNTMQVPVPINNIFLECVYGDNLEIETQLHMDSDSEVPAVIDRNEFSVEVLPDVSLDSNEKRKVHLKVYPKQEGRITVLGVRYLLCGVIPAYYRFNRKGRRLNDTAAQRQDPVGVYAPDTSLKILVTSPMPVLDVVVHSLPESMLMGQVSQIAVELVNKGTRGLKNLHVKSNMPTSFCFGDSTSLDLPTYGQTSGAQTSEHQEVMTVPNSLVNPSIVPLQLPLPDHIAPLQSSPITSSKEHLMQGMLPASMTTLVPAWIRGDRPGKQTLKLVFMYQSEDQKAYRILRYKFTLVVNPLLRVNTFTRTSLDKFDEFILGVEMENVHPSLSLRCHQITSISPSWHIVGMPLSSTSSSSDEGSSGGDDSGKKAVQISCELGPNQTYFQYFRIRRWKERTVSSILSQSPELITTSAIERLIFQEDSVSLLPQDIQLCVHSLGDPSNMVSATNFPFSSIVHTNRVVNRLAYLSTQYPGLSSQQVAQLFTLYWSDDLDLIFHWETLPQLPTAVAIGAPPASRSMSAAVQRGHMSVSGGNLSLYSPLPLAAWFGQLDAKTLAGRALFSATVRERKALVGSLLKARNKESCPVRVLVKCLPDVSLDQNGFCCLDVTIVLGNTSWMHVAEYNLEAISSVARDDTQSSSATESPSSVVSSPLIGTQPNFSWIGPSHHKGVLAPLSSVKIPLVACFSSTGLYDINRWKLETVLKFVEEGGRPLGSPARTHATGGSGSGSGSGTTGSAPTGATAIAINQMLEQQKTSQMFVQVPTMPQHVLVGGFKGNLV
eukprot:jgi/Hompol1/1425/HPOL_001386-RA